MESKNGITRESVGIAGVAEIPNQAYHVASYKHIRFNILLLGEVTLGKTAQVNRMLGRQLIANDLAPYASRQHEEVLIRERQQDLVEDDFHVALTLVDCPSVGHSIRKDVG